MGRGYVDIRKDLDDPLKRYMIKGKENEIGKWKRLMISRRGEPKMPDPPKESKDNRGEYKKLTAIEVKARRKRYKEDFPNTVIDIDAYSGINQGREGACSFVAFLNMIHLAGRDELFKSKWEIVKRSWKTMWKKLKIDGKSICAAEDIAEMLDLVNENKILGDFSLPLRYFPIRSRKNGENNFNIEIAGTNQNDTALKVQKKIEGLLKQGTPVEINFAEHSRVAVGYNKTHLLFADSWGNKYYEQSADGRDTNAAGFSTVQKDAVYAYAREIAYFNKKSKFEEEMLKNLKIANLEKTSDDEEEEDSKDALREGFKPRRSTRRKKKPPKYEASPNLKF